jgi:subtilisin family serine protease
MSAPSHLIIGHDTTWTGESVDLADLARRLQGREGIVSVKQSGKALVVSADETATAALLTIPPDGVIVEKMTTFTLSDRPAGSSGSQTEMAVAPSAAERMAMAKKHTSDSGSAARPRATRLGTTSVPASEANTPTVAPLQVGTREYLLGPRRGVRAAMNGLTPPTAAQLDKALALIEPHELVRTVNPRAPSSPLALTASEARHHMVAELTVERAAELRDKLPPEVILEPKVVFEHRPAAMPAAPAMAQAIVTGPSAAYDFVVLGESEKPLAGVPISIYTVGGGEIDAVSDSNGEATITVQQLSGAPLKGFYAKPPNTYWDLYVIDPVLRSDCPNVVRLRALDEIMPSFLTGFRYGWGQRVMGLGQLPPEYDGRGVKVAIIDSGADNSHPQLAHIQFGSDLTVDPPGDGWNQDQIGHGTHVAGIIGARPAGSAVFAGFAPGAEVHALKIFPGGDADALLDALETCLHLNVDVVNMSLGSPQNSELVDQKIEELAAAGIACIVAAGNSGDAVQFPARSAFVLAVAAVGQSNNLVTGSWDVGQFQSQFASDDGVFSPRFTCYGPEIGICAPGVGIVSTLPGGKYGPDTGTSMAAPHITGLAALLLAHHPALGPQAVPRDGRRVAALFNLIRSLAAPYPFGLERTGAGLATLLTLGQGQDTPRA